MQACDENAEHPMVDARTYIKVWGCLLFLTATTIGVSFLNLGKLSTATAVAIATVKASIVLLIFMGLKYDKPIFRYMFLVTIITLAIFIILTYVDVIFR